MIQESPICIGVHLSADTHVMMSMFNVIVKIIVATKWMKINCFIYVYNDTKQFIELAKHNDMIMLINILLTNQFTSYCVAA